MTGILKRGRRKLTAEDGGVCRPPPRTARPVSSARAEIVPYMFSFPAVLAVSAILAYPVLAGVYQSLFRPEELGLEEEWVGFENYVDLFNDEEFWRSLYRTAIFVGGSLFVSLSLGLFFAFALYRATGGLRWMRAATLAPYLISNVAAAVMFRLMFNTDLGIINSFLAWFGIDGPAWLSTKGWSMIVVIMTQTWTDLPLTILLLLGGLMTIDRSIPRRRARRRCGLVEPSVLRHHPAARAADRHLHRLDQLLHAHGTRCRARPHRRWSRGIDDDAGDGDVQHGVPRPALQRGVGPRHVHPRPQRPADPGVRRGVTTLRVHRLMTTLTTAPDVDAAIRRRDHGPELVEAQAQVPGGSVARSRSCFWRSGPSSPSSSPSPSPSRSKVETFANLSLIPDDPSLAAYREVIDDPNFASAFINSLIVGIGTAIVTIVIGLPAAYAFARFNFRGRHLLLLFTLLPRLVPTIGVMVPLYRSPSSWAPSTSG